MNDKWKELFTLIASIPDNIDINTQNSNISLIFNIKNKEMNFELLFQDDKDQFGTGIIFSFEGTADEIFCYLVNKINPIVINK